MFKKFAIAGVALAGTLLVGGVAQADDRHHRHGNHGSHGRLHDDLDHNEFHRHLEHRRAHRYRMNPWEHGRLHDDLDHDRFHDQLRHRSYHRSDRYRSYRPSYGRSYGRSYSFGRSGFGIGISPRGFSLRIGR